MIELILLGLLAAGVWFFMRRGADVRRVARRSPPIAAETPTLENTTAGAESAARSGQPESRPLGPRFPILMDAVDYPWPDPRNDCATYAHGLLTLLAQRPRQGLTVTAGRPLPDLADFTVDVADLEWVHGLPFKYERLSADWIIGFLVGLAKYPSMDDPVIRTTLHAKVASANGVRDVSFRLTATNAPRGVRQLEIECQDPDDGLLRDAVESALKGGGFDFAIDGDAVRIEQEAGPRALTMTEIRAACADGSREGWPETIRGYIDGALSARALPEPTRTPDPNHLN